MIGGCEFGGDCLSMALFKPWVLLLPSLAGVLFVPGPAWLILLWCD